MGDDAPTRAWRTVLESIERDLLDGRVGPGDRLASERDLASHLGVGRSSVREALRVLEVLGLIRTATGSGPGAGAIVVATPTGGMATLLRLQLAAQGFPLADVVATRLVLESATVAALADAGRPAGDEVHRALEAMDAPQLGPAEFLSLDARLHLALAEASGNLVIAAVMAGLRSAIESYVLAGAERLADWDATAAVLRDEHRAIVAAVDDGDADLARTLVTRHITGYYAAAGLGRPA